MNPEGAITLRPLHAEDKDRLFRWRNLPEIVSRTTTQNTISRADHEAWFRETISSERRKMSIVLLDGEPIGQVRFDAAGENRCAISIYLLPQFTGVGYGVTAIRIGCKQMAAQGCLEVLACVRRDNPFALSAFAKAGFVQQSRAASCPDGQIACLLAL